MNFLAHIYLSNDLPKIMVGNFIGDFVKGRNLLAQFEPDIAKGIQLHRIIDEFTDSHAVVRQSKLKLRPKYRHYSAVIVDVFYDHFLSKYWSEYHPVLLPVFAQNVYHIFETHREILPVEVKKMLPHMVSGNWLVNYGTFGGIQQALTGLSRRTRYESNMDQSIHELEVFYPEFKEEFESFFPELKSRAADFLMDVR